jgi:hypothetical protein
VHRRWLRPRPTPPPPPHHPVSIRAPDCHSLLSLVRDGILGQWGMEQLLARYGVEVTFWAHEQ